MTELKQIIEDLRTIASREEFEGITELTKDDIETCLTRLDTFHLEPEVTRLNRAFTQLEKIAEELGPHDKDVVESVIQIFQSNQQ